MGVQRLTALEIEMRLESYTTLALANWSQAKKSPYARSAHNEQCLRHTGASLQHTEALCESCVRHLLVLLCSQKHAGIWV